MFWVDHLFELLLMATMLFFSGFFSGTETALFSLSREQMKHLREHGDHVSRLLTLLSEHPSALLVAVLFGNLLVNILFFSISVVFATALAMQYGEWWSGVAGVVVLLLVILVGEILPKAVGISYPERVVKLNAAGLRWWIQLIAPIRRILEWIVRKLEPSGSDDHQLSSEELRLLVEATRHDATFGTQEKAIAEDIVSLPEVRVREVMVPRVDQLMRHADTRCIDVLKDACEDELHLIPVYEEDEDDIIGVVDICDLFATADPERPVRELCRPVHFVPETKRVDSLLREVLQKNLRLMCVVDEYGGLAGTVCLEDLFEELVGEFDAQESPPVEQLGESTYLLQGNLSIREWRTLFVGFLSEEMFRSLSMDTVGGLVITLLKRLPTVGDIAHLQNLKFTVEQVRGNRILSVRLELDHDPEEEDVS